MRADVYVYSKGEAGPSKTFFLKNARRTTGLPPIDSMYPLSTQRRKGINVKKGVVKSVDSGKQPRILLETEMSTEELRAYLISEGWKEISAILE